MRRRRREREIVVVSDEETGATFSYSARLILKAENAEIHFLMG